MHGGYFYIQKQHGVIRKDRSDVALYCGRKGFPPDIFPARHEKGACVAQEKWERYIIDLHRAEFIAGGNGNPAQYNTEDNKNICEAVILTRKQVGFFVLHIYSVMKTAKRCTFRKIF